MVMRSIIIVITVVGSLLAALKNDGAERDTLVKTNIVNETCGISGCCCGNKMCLPMMVSCGNTLNVRNIDYRNK